MGTIVVRPEDIKRAAQVLHDKDTSYGTDENPDVSVYEQAVERWLEYSIDSILKEPEWWAYGPYSHVTTEFEHALEWSMKEREP